MKIMEGQIWEWVGTSIRNRRIANRDEVMKLTGPVVILEIISLNGSYRGLSGYYKGRVLRDDMGIFFDAEQFSDGYYVIYPIEFISGVNDGMWQLIFDGNELIVSRCSKCRIENPYIDYDPNFKCWGCRNGY